jgi:hypothetical protein
MARVLQRLQRRALVALAWLLLALSVAPAAAEPVRPVAVCAAALSSRSSLAADPRGLARSAGSAEHGARSASSAVASPHVASPGRRLPRAIEPILAASSAVVQRAPSPARSAGARDERRLYLSLCRLAC